MMNNQTRTRTSAQVYMEAICDSNVTKTHLVKMYAYLSVCFHQRPDNVRSMFFT